MFRFLGMIAFLVLVWGLSWPIYKVTLAYTPPLLFAGMRALIGGLLFAIPMLPKRNVIRFRENWRVYAVSALLNVVCFFGIQTVGLLYLPSGLFSVIVYLQPVLLGIFAWLWLGESMSALKIVGLLLGFLGVFVVSAGGMSGQISIVGILMAVATALFWALGVIYVKKSSQKVDAFWMVSMQSIIGGAILTVVGLITEGGSHIVWNGTYVFGLSFGAIFGIAIAFAIYYKLVNAGDASKVASITFLVPLIAVVAGTLFLHEPFSYALVVGLLLIGASIFLVNRKAATKRPQPTGALHA